MKVLMITPFMSPVIGGISTFLDGLSNELSGRERTVCVVVAEKGQGTHQSPRTHRSLPRFLAEGILAAFSLKPDVIHIHSNWRGFLIASVYRWLNRATPVFFTFHTDSLSPLLGLKKKVFERMLRMCDTLIFTSSYLLSQTKDSFSYEAQAKVVYAGVAKTPVSEKQVQDFAERYSLRDRFPVLVYMTPFVWKEKISGIETLGKALRNLTDHSLSPCLIVLGEGDLFGETQARIGELGLDDIVVFAGGMDNPWIALSACDIYAHISMRESLSMSILEAMSIGKPVIVADVGGSREIISKEGVGILVSPDLEDIEEAILTLCADRKEMEAVGRRAKELVETEFTWSKSAEEHLRLYREAIGETENSGDH
ncbi:MAG: glycosyltransferase family 4 protein [Thermoplasmata archaeon]